MTGGREERTASSNAAREGHPPARGGVGRIATVTGAVILTAGAILAIGDMLHTSNPRAAVPGAGGAAVEIEARNYGFVPTTVVVPANATVTITVRNRSISTHTFTSEQLGADALIPPGETRTFTVHTGGRGTIDFYCRFHENFGMRGHLAIR